MSAIELKKLLHLEIESSQNYPLLEALLSYFQSDSHLEEPVQLSPALKSKIAKGRMDVAKKQTQTDDEVNQEIDEWLSK